MYSNNKKITNTQIKKLLVFDILSLSIIILPGIAATGAGRDGLPAIALGSLAALVYSLFFLFIINKLNVSYIDFSKNTVGKFLTVIIGILYITKILFSCWFTLAVFAKVINDTLLPETNIKIIISSLILVSIYAAWKGIEVRARLAELFFFIVLVPLVLLFILGLRRVELANLFPLFTEIIQGEGTQAEGIQRIGIQKISYTSYSVLLTYSAIELLLFAVPELSASMDKKNRAKNVIKAVLVAAAMNIFIFILVLGLLGLAGAQQQFKSSVMIMQLIQIPGGLVQRQDALMLTIWMLSIFTILSAYFFYLTHITSSVININKKQYYLLFWAALVFGLSFIKLPIESLFSYYGKYMAYVGFPQSIIIPLFIIIISRLRAGKGAL